MKTKISCLVALGILISFLACTKQTTGTSNPNPEPTILEYRTAILGTYISTGGTCGGPLGNDTLLIKAGAIDSKIIFGTKDFKDKFEGTVQGKSFIMTEYLDTPHNTKFGGTGKLEGKTLTIDFTIKDINGPFSGDCKAILTK